MDSFAPGTLLARFRIVQELGRGGMGIVYRAHDEQHRRDVALKVLPAHFASHAEHRVRFLREARAGASLTHPNIVVVHEIGEAEGRIFVAMELVEGESLRSRIERGALAGVEAVAIARAIAAALACAHQRRLVHRDLKPDNVMLGSDGHVKVLDFGIAKDLGADAFAPTVSPGQASLTGGAIIGTPAYMSPEQATGQPVTPASDVFSFGVLLYELLSGARPFEGSAVGALIVAITRDPPRPLELRESVSPELEALVLRCLAKEAAERPASGAELVAAVARLPEATGELLAIAARSPATDAPATTDAPSTAMDAPATDARSPATDARSASLEQEPPRTPSARWRAPRVLGLSLVLALAAAGAWMRFGSRATRLPEDARSSAVGAGSAAPAASPLDLPGRPGAKPEVIALWRAALRTHHDGLLDNERGAQRRVIDADALFTPARVQFAALSFVVTDIDEVMRSEARRARAEVGSLTERDRLLLEATEARVLRVPANDDGALQVLRAATERFPEDAQLWYFRACVEAMTAGRKAAVDSLRRALALDPTYLAARFVLAQMHCYNGDLPAAREELDRCLRQMPSSQACLQQLEIVDANEGHCEAFEAGARNLVLASPGGMLPNAFLSNALVFRGESAAASDSLLSVVADAGTDPEAVAIDPWYRASFAQLSGDFTTALAHTRRGIELVKDDRREVHQGVFAVQLALLLDESGDASSAERTAADYLARRPGLEPVSRSDDFGITFESVPWLVPLALRGGALRQSQGEAQLTRWSSAWKQKLAKGYVGYVWPNGAAIGALVLGTEEAGRQALAAFDPNVPVPQYLPFSAGQATTGIAFFLGGRVSEAIPWLERATHNCMALDGAFPQTRAFYYLGRAREQTGDTTRACAAYERVLERWGKAKPRSITADKARAHAKALDCKPVP